MIFPILNLEAKVQEGDKTRLDATQTFAVGGDEITLIEITPAKGENAIDVTADKYLDWAYAFKLDINPDNHHITFDEGSGWIIATVQNGSHTLSDLAGHLKTALDAAGALTYTVSLTADDAFLISATGAFSLDPEGTNSLLPEIGFPDAVSGLAEYEGDAIETVNKLVTLDVSFGTPTPTTETIERVLVLVSEKADRLFSSDDLLRKHEPDIFKFLPEGRASFKDVHRRAQELILAWLHKEGFIDDAGDPITVSQIKYKEDVAEWATFMALRLLFEGVSNATDDVFSVKAAKYEKLERFYRDRAYVRVGSAVDFDRVDIRSARVVRR